MKKKWFKNKTQMIIYLIIFVLLFSGFIYFGNLDYESGASDSEKFSSEFKNVPKDNVFTYINSSEAYSKVRTDDTIILFGISYSGWVEKYATILNEVAKEVGITQIFYYDFDEDRTEQLGTYQSIVNYLDDFVLHLDDNTAELYGPTLLIKKGGVVTLFDDETSYLNGNITPDEYWSKYQIGIKKEMLRTAFKYYLGEVDGEK